MLIVRNEIIAGMTERCARTMAAEICPPPENTVECVLPPVPFSRRGERARDRTPCIIHTYSFHRKPCADILVRPTSRDSHQEKIDRPINRFENPRTRRYFRAPIIYSHRVYIKACGSNQSRVREARHILSRSLRGAALPPPPPPSSRG